ncbi:hypothetical protein [Marinobacter confluentis]|uniref:Lipoprotein n=1 Tax=Marinobacter confluentis TaxID=1697557 RepID=A0A4Z1BPB3_9GAMM|nr:hypothetical protein [Marinobacter confluentis]TGN39337.1 hypothetical protein E5Q11_11890 [Marinobacter confluentis]
MKRFLKVAIPLMVTGLMTGCFDSSSSSSSNDRPDPTVEFSTFVTNEIQNTDDTREPVNINELEFSFNEQTNEQAFDELFIQ